MPALLLAALVGVLHVHHEPSHDSDAAFQDVLAAAHAAELDFLVLTEHAPDDATGGPLPAIEHVGLHRGPDGRELLVLAGVELGTADGHLLALDVRELMPANGRPGRDVIADIHRQGGFAVVPHPFTHGGWSDWDAPFDGIEVHNNASAFRRISGPLLPFRILRAVVARDAALRAMLVRPDAELAKQDELLAAGRPVRGYSGADAHQNVSVLGAQLDPYAQMFEAVQTVCPDGPLEPDALWRTLRSGCCHIRYALFDDRADEARRVDFPGGRSELQLDDGRRVLELSDGTCDADAAAR